MLEHRANTLRIITDMRIPKKMIGQATALPSQRVSDFCNEVALPNETESRIVQAVERIQYVWQIFQPFRIELSSPELLETAVRNADNVRLDSETRALAEEVREAMSAIGGTHA